MTLKQCVKKNGIQFEAIKLIRVHTYDINFINSDEVADETQFDAENINELNVLFTIFCKENGFAKNTVTNLSIIASNYNHSVTN